MEVTEQLSGVIDAMAADNYELRVVDAGSDALELAIEAREGACEDCLASPPVFATIVSGALGGRYRPEQIRIAYPVEAG
jgi:hypothetical protein